MTITPALNPASPSSYKEASTCGQPQPPDIPDGGESGLMETNSVDVIPIPNPAALEALERYTEAATSNPVKMKDLVKDPDEVDSRYGGHSSSSEQMPPPSSYNSYGPPPTVSQASLVADQFPNQLYQTGIENLSRVASSYQPR